MTQEEKISLLEKIRLDYAFLGTPSFDVLTNAIDALKGPWVKTADRAPTEADGAYGAGGDIVVIALTKYAHGYYPELVSIKKLVSPDYPAFLTLKYFPYWMPIPENPGEWKEE